ncbi:dihydrolipoamide acetyltransferase family protein [Rhodopila globiformis]|uniref:Dihydrolipoamide acetyltransferase component of pyruvate dehydrogenase complex n=1 Tax=Rhodopila globiformis TaxID=1071 RepID=A0A2S6NLB6_RHOGL|nr:dihydrolipoamide acetyltransferase family protein [Rhodopila globiformis]PPQ36101.1 branched-chain alpha-keto acid dehydrogenase subunit E2 [Rhodopila globiformis]
MIEFRMPSLGADMEAGTMAEWLVRPGDHVKRGDVVAVVETQKGAIEIEIFNDGIVSELTVAVGESVPVGTVLARLDGAGAPAPAVPAPPVTAPAAAPVAAPMAAPREPSGTERSGLAPTHPRISPAARRLAAERGIDISLLPGTGPGGAIVVADVEAYAPEARPPRPRTGFDPAAMRQAIAAAMTRSKREIPHYYLTQTLDLAAALSRLERLNADRPPPERILPAALFLRAIALALAKLPDLNGFWQDGRFRPGDGIHVGWAIALRGGGLVAPAIRDADRRTLEELMAAMRDLVQRARGSGLRGSELTDPTITVTSLGERGAESVLPIIHPPQVAMLGIGRVVTRPWVVDGAIVPRPVVTVSLAGDHRASDGHRGGLLLAEIDRLLRNAEAL